ncbi:IS607 family transposase [Streptomyces sp. NPDC002057]|uniref:IS607 family transposase n=1 Tax=Streptomyces sp. NPDC002057 TaxID=3154664 RepID=UPI00331ABB7F
MSNNYRIGEFAERIGRSAATVRRWEREGRITPKRTASGQRYFDDADVRAALNVGSTRQERITVAYCRVSSPDQTDDLVSQVAALEQFCLARGIAVDEWLRDIGSGMDLCRERLLDVMDRIEDGKIGHLLVAHKDRLARFGFEYLEHVARRHGCELTVVNIESLSPRRELVDDLLAVVSAFSHRVDGLGDVEKALRSELRSPLR